MADSPERIAAALRYLQEKKAADPLESFRSLGALKDAYQPVLNNARQFAATGAGLGELLRAYGSAAAPAQATVAKGMGIPYQGPMTAPREEGVTSGENFSPMGRDTQQRAGQMLGDPVNLLPMVGPAARGAVVAGKAAGRAAVRGAENLAAPAPFNAATRGQGGATLWHGSPHRFPPTAKNPLGEFDPMKVGTGEGAQAYGVGAGYLAESPAVGKEYAQRLSRNAYVDTKPEILAAFNANHEASMAYMKALIDRGNGKNVGPIDDLLAKSEQTSKAYDNAIREHGPQLYKVDLPDEHIAKMLDYDKPLSQQPKSVQAALSKYDADMYHPSGADYDPNETGQQIINRLAGTLAVRTPSPLSGQDLASQWLNNNGIPGIRYLDGGSRGAGAGTSNFVVFDPAHMNILERNGVTAASLRNVAPQDEALRLAQQRAALPVEQHGLGLPAGNTPQQRAAAMGAVDSYHGTNDDILSVDLGKSGLKTGNPNAALGFFSTPNSQEASRYATGWGSTGANVMPLKLFPEQTYQMPFKELDDMAMLPYRKMMADPTYNPKSVVKFGNMKGQRAAADKVRSYEGEARQQVEQRRDKLIAQGYDSAIVNRGKPMEEFISMRPDNIRSRFAAFDPWRRNSALAAALGVAAPDLLAKEK